MKGRWDTRSVLYFSALATILLAAGHLAMAWDTYSVDGSTGNCADCHGDFRAFYTSLKPGVGSWLDDMHDVHRNNMLDRDCDVCHDPSGRSPVYMASSTGGTGIPAISCVGCHGRAEDVGPNSGYGAGLRQHHFRTGTTSCANTGCHADADPANYTPVSEAVLPPYYSATANYPDMPSDPCNPDPAFPEDVVATTIGLDNDGDDVYDMADSDCNITAATPGETSAQGLQPLLVDAFDPGAGTLTLSYDAACAVTDHNLEWGDLGSVATYGYGAQTANECGIGAGGSYVWSYPATPGDIFFLVVGNDGSAEGSLGLDSSSAERPENSGGICDVPQILADRCD